MRTKEEILKDVRQDITNPEYQYTSRLWTQHRMIEVLIDIRDILRRDMDEMIKRAIQLKTKKSRPGKKP